MGAGVYNSCGAGALRGNLRRGNASNARGGFVAQHPSRQNRLSLLAICVALACAVPARRAAGGDLARDSVPQKWIEPLLPEDLPELTYPAYFNDFDKARAQSFSGRYKQSLHTLAKLKDVKPEQAAAVALVKGKALWAPGRLDEALQTLSHPALAGK